MIHALVYRHLKERKIWLEGFCSCPTKVLMACTLNWGFSIAGRGEGGGIKKETRWWVSSIFEVASGFEPE